MTSRSKDFAMALMLRDQHLSGRIFGWFEAAIVWSLYKHGRNPHWPCVDTCQDDGVNGLGVLL